ncbi:MAG: HAMP domain-containing sensor histidine kinase [Acidimicrobiales bacterium]|jgi:two-component system OmpR family sensor kinase
MSSRLSLRTRLLLAVGAVALVALAFADVTVYASLKSYLYRQVDATLEVSHISVEQAATGPTGQNGTGSGPPPYGQEPGNTNFCAIGRESAPGMFIEVRNAHGAVVGNETCPAFTPGKVSYSPKLPSTISGFSLSAADPDEPVVYFTVPSTSTAGPPFRVRASKLRTGGILFVAIPVNNVTSTLDQLVVLELLVTGGALVGAVLLGLWLVRVGLRPLSDVVRTAEAITAGDLMHRVPNANDRTEVGHVAIALNVMLERIQAAFRDLQISENRLRRFVSDASHELRTPIAAVSAYAQLFKQASQHEEDLPRVLDGIERETARMGRLVEDLLLLARVDEQHPFDLEPVELVGLVAEAVETARTVGPAWPIRFIAGEPVEVLGDWGALRQVVDNLLGNVRAHTPPATVASVTVGRSGEEAFVEVADEGPGISEQQAAVVFERFFRADPSRSRETGGAGLGLAIVATIVRVHGGHVTAEPRPGGGALFKVVLPALEAVPTSED